MPKLKNVLSAEDQFNLMISIIGIVNRQEPIRVSEVARILGVSEEAIRKAISSIVVAGDESGDTWYPYNFDGDALEEHGVLMWTNPGIMEFNGAPRISIRQAAAISAGLSFLKSTPAFAVEADIDHLIKLLSSAQTPTSVPSIRFERGTINADIEIIRTAILGAKRISCRYTNQRGERSERELDPLRLQATGQYWYLKAWCPLNEEVREFRIDRMSSVEISINPRSDEAEKIALDLDSLDDRLYVPGDGDTEVTLEVEPEAYELVSEFATLEQPKLLDHGRVRVKIKVGYLPNLGHLIARYAGAARVIEPESARVIVKNYALTALGETVEETKIDSVE